MNTTTSSHPTARFTLPAEAPAAARAVFKLLDRIEHGRIEIHWPDGRHSTHPAYRPGTDTTRATLHIHRWRVFDRTIQSGDIGFAESYIDGDWSTPDLSALLGLVIRNRNALEDVLYGSWWGSLLYRVRHWLNRNSRSGSARNIHAHYDLGNAFYQLWLDPSMNYSSAWFEGQTADLARQDLQQGQLAKMRRALDEAQVMTGSQVLEIGCGWGALAETAARERGAHVTGVTLSREQLDWGQRRLAQAGLNRLTDLRYQDYRDLADQHASAPFDAIVSIEMFEAVGRAYWPSYFDTIHRCLKPGGHACIQTITIRDDLFERYAHSTDFIQQYIFPGGMLPSIERFHAMAQQHGLEVCNTFSFGQDYATTLHLWRQQFLQQLPQVRAQGFDDAFIRTWEFYLVYCEAGFRSGNISVAQFTLRKP